MTTPPPLPFRIGHGFDLHRLEPRPPDGAGRPLILGGIPIEHDAGPIAHSDGDAVLHALTDAILGALALPDIGELFPDTSPKWKDAPSDLFLREALSRARAAGYAVGNVDLTVILERPRLSNSKNAMRTRIAELLEITPSQVNLKGKTHERLDALGEGRGVAVHCIVLLQRREGAGL